MSSSLDHDREKARLRRQMRAVTPASPRLQGLTERLLRDQARWIRIPVGLFLICGGIASILPIFGLWMLPIGLVLLAFDLPILRPGVNATLIRSRRWTGEVSRRWRGRRRGRD
ncbi:tryptophan synthase subunit beta [Limimaricola pyoseonensis]|uniref:Transmembrane protein (PGPGW) n=1 Tax=Limimaricola pyoseonensis TaxID=521013 RepID=A0A1G7IEA4_9RHOB|nr:tryptophan synthase subunit beta [Limimaricola pyoseonensis]SDF10955.1 hypothetical protein SAMN04488567_3429 [Limimaricola pyoseonensis]